MNAQLQRHHDLFDDSIPRSSARDPSAALPGPQSPPVAEDRFILSREAPAATTGKARQVDPLWMITGAAALLFIFLAAAVSFS
ncbi:MAG TPA: hypothetical protein VGE08_06345 [Steroidobacter sp.]|uniref:hypothetical protein n=1 Tax=Steroidobacter sp. TaxID=1978227 RepID=UPI002EDA631A